MFARLPWRLRGKESASVQEMETRARSVGQEGPMEEGVATHSSILAGKIPWAGEPSGLQSMESPRVVQDRSL